jgi:hypothetical protein
VSEAATGKCVNHATLSRSHITIFNRKLLNFSLPRGIAKNVFMLFYYYIYLLIALTGLFLLIKFLVARKKDIPVEFFVAALRNENNGCYEEAVVTYEKALTEAKKSRLHNMLKIKIIEKIKVLHTIIDYQNSIHYIRQEV